MSFDTSSSATGVVVSAVMAAAITFSSQQADNTVEVRSRSQRFIVSDGVESASANEHDQTPSQSSDAETVVLSAQPDTGTEESLEALSVATADRSVFTISADAIREIDREAEGIQARLDAAYDAHRASRRRVRE